MEDVNLKIKLLFVRFLLILVGFFVLYSLFHWLLVIRWGLIDANETVFTWYLPMTLPIIPLCFFLWKRIKLLNLREAKGDQYFGYMLFAHIFIAAVVISFQYYVISAAGEIKQVDTPAQIVQEQRAKYYLVAHYTIHVEQARWKLSESTSGKNVNRKTNFTLSVAAPMRDPDLHLYPAFSEVWFGMRYRVTMDYNSSLEKKDSVQKALYEEGMSDFKDRKLMPFTYLYRLGNTDERAQYLQAIEAQNLKGPAIQQILMPSYEPLEQRNGLALFRTIAILVGVLVIWLCMIVYKDFDQDALQRFLEK